MSDGNNMMDEYIVYGHFEGDEVVYVGHGRSDRMWLAGGSFRSEAHSQWIRERSPLEVTAILCRTPSKARALFVERQIIWTDRPRFNKVGKHTPSIREALERGERQVDIAANHGTTQTTISLHKQKDDLYGCV